MGMSKGWGFAGRPCDGRGGQKESRVEESEAWIESTTISIEKREERQAGRRLRADKKSLMLIRVDKKHSFKL